MIKYLNTKIYNASWQGEKLLFWYTFLMAFPVITPLVNASFLIFPFLIYIYSKNFGNKLFYKGLMYPIIIIFIIGIILNLLSVMLKGEDRFVKNTLRVVPNYIYWLILINFLFSYRNYINFRVILKGLLWGLMISILYYFINKEIKISSTMPILKYLSQNTFAFLLICFSPLVIYYIKYRYNTKIALLIYIFFITIGFLSGSRSSSILVLFFGFSVLFIGRIRFSKTLINLAKSFWVSEIENEIKNTNEK